MKPYLFFDFDNTKFHTTPALMSYINRRWNINSIESDYIDKNDDIELIIRKYRNNIKISREEVYEDLGNNFNNSIVEHERVEPLKDMCGIVTLLSEKYNMWTVTARQKEGMLVIMHILNKYIPKCISGVHCVWEHMGNGEFKETSKRSFIESMPGQNIAFVDDSPKEILKMQSLIPSYLFDPNRIHEDLIGIDNRIYSWKEIGEKFL